jgi:dihydroxy-acid dehydratase
VAPEAAEGGAIGLVEDGDMISIDLGARRMDLEVDSEEMAARREVWEPPVAKYQRGWLSRYTRMVTNASRGAVLA